MTDKFTDEAGYVAVLYSTGYGSGWSTWNADERQECLFDPEIVKAVLDGKDERSIRDLAEEKWPDGYWGGADGLKVRFLPPGTRFRVDENDGYEFITIADEVTWSVA